MVFIHRAPVYIRAVEKLVVCHGGVLRVLEMILNATPPSEIMQVVMPQDRVYKWDGTSASWI